jgi:hypothetical protein
MRFSDGPKKYRNRYRLTDSKETCVVGGAAAARIMRFFISSTGQMGLAPHRAEAGDLTCVIFDSLYPVIFRPRDHFYTVVGDVYAFCLIYRAAMKGLSDEKYTFKEFELH